MTSVNELNAYNRGMKEGERVGRLTKKNDVLDYIASQRELYLELNHLAKAKLMGRILDKFK